MAKKTIEEIREYVKNASGGNCELLSKEYRDKKTPLLLKCSCGNTFERKWENFSKSIMRCKECANKERSEKYRLNIEDVIKNINSTGCTYISGDYTNYKSLLEIKCKCGNIFKKKYCDFAKGQQRCVECGFKNLSKSKTKYNLEIVSEIVSKDGYTILEDEYLGSHSKMRCVCSKGHEFNLVFSQYLQGCSGCQKCSWKKNSGKGHVFYKNGESKVTDALRNSVDGWRNNLLQIYKNKCPITGSGDVVTHHLYPFAKILKECSSKTGVPVLKRIGDYAEYENFAKLKESVVEYHWKHDIGIVISKELHDLFHNEYGDKDNTTEQFDEFLKEKYNINLKDVFIKTIKQ